MIASDKSISVCPILAGALFCFWLTEVSSVKAPKQSKMEKYKTHLFHLNRDGPSTQDSHLIGH